MHTNPIYKENDYFTGGGSGGGGGYTPFGETSAYHAIMSGQTNSIRNINGRLVWSTLDDANAEMYYDEDGMLTGTTGGVTWHSMKTNTGVDNFFETKILYFLYSRISSSRY